MSLLLYMDHNVHAGITRGLRDRGVDCVTALEDGMAAAEDSVILLRASQVGRVVFTQDMDFLAIAAQWLRAGREFAGVIYARQMGITIGQAIADLELMSQALNPADMQNIIEWIPLQ